MPPFVNPHAPQYMNQNGWNWFTPRLDIRDEGWKLHVSGNIGNTQTILNLVLPVLIDGMIGHKYLPDTTSVAGQTGHQKGKVLAVYPDSIVQAFMIVSEIDRVLTGTVGRHQSPCILNEKWVGTTVVYTRYGAYSGSILRPDGIYVDDPIGQVKPDWINDPWVHYPDVTSASAFPVWPVHDSKGWRRKGRH